MIEADETEHWADPEPAIVDLLRRVGARDLSDEELVTLQQRCTAIVTEWDKHEDVAALSRLLGLRGARGRRRSQRVVNFEVSVAVLAELCCDELSQGDLAERCELSKRVLERHIVAWRAVAKLILEGSLSRSAALVAAGIETALVVCTAVDKTSLLWWSADGAIGRALSKTDVRAEIESAYGRRLKIAISRR